MDEQGLAIDLKRLLQQLQDLRHHRLHLAALGHTLQQHQELVLAQTRQHGLHRQVAAQAARHGVQQGVTDGMTQAFIDQLKAVDIGRDQRKGGAAGARQLAQASDREIAVGQVGQLVMQGLTAQRVDSPLARAVVDHHQQLGRRAVPFRWLDRPRT